MDPQPQLFLEPIKEFLQGTTSSPLSAIAETFLQIVPDSVHFQVALSVLLPIMNDLGANMVCSRFPNRLFIDILFLCKFVAVHAQESRLQSAFLLWYLYRNHSLDINPFQATFREALNGERSRHANIAGTTTPNALQSTLDIILCGQAPEVELRFSYDGKH